ncbi:MAG: hypothetical protein A3K25_13460 [Planctomycetes bacterium RIFOXYB12_FULL_42_10]|nr:MAG: hypothetical protein A3K25_13460 [Planctomycetes bacterium RIFOXYB12_FULL_42_10]
MPPKPDVWFHTPPVCSPVIISSKCIAEAVEEHTLMTPSSPAFDSGLIFMVAKLVTLEQGAVPGKV